MNGIVVTGANGFLGRAFTAQLDRMCLSYIALSRKSLPGLRQVSDYAECPSSDIIVHLAEEPDRVKVNHHLGENYVDHAASVVRRLSARAGLFIYASSGVVYGDAREVPCTIATSAIATDRYSESKIRNENIALDSGGTVLRLSNLYGQGMSANNVLSDIVKQIPGTGPLRVRDETPVRDFLAVAEAAEAMALVVRACACGIFNIGSGKGLSIRRVAQLALRTTGEEGRAVHSTQAPARRSINILDISETQRRLGWSPSAPEDGLEQFFRNGASLDN